MRHFNPINRAPPWVKEIRNKLVKHPNFYETVKEAQLRLCSTVIMYSGPGEVGPYYVMSITDHIPDGKFRIYMKPLGQKYNPTPGMDPSPSEQVARDNPGLGPLMDQFMKVRPQWGIVRKDMNSPHFNNFRPFPLGMMNAVTRDKAGKALECEALYTERQPNRKSEQGLIRSMVYCTTVNAAMRRSPSPAGYNFDLFSPEFRDCIMGEYPDADECLSKLRDPKIANEAIAFDRYFAFVRGPIDMMLLCYKGDIIGALPDNNLKTITIGREHTYTREAVRDLQIFNNIQGR